MHCVIQLAGEIDITMLFSLGLRLCNKSIDRLAVVIHESGL